MSQHSSLKLFVPVALCMVFFLGLQPARGQASVVDPVDSKSKTRLERKNRKNLREAEKYASDYKDTHLNTDNYQYKTGSAGRKAAKAKKRAAIKEKKLKIIRSR